MYDIAIIGGGINGCGIARDAAGRGYSVFLAEKNDLACGTSSGSTKLIHGGLRYLEYYEFKLVRESLREREVLWAMAPHIIWPLRFVLPYTKGLRPAWLLRLGLFLYDHLGGRRLLPGTRVLDLRSDPAGAALRPGFSRAFEYSDCWVDDARLVVLNAKDAADRGGVIRTRASFQRVERVQDHWRATIRNERTGKEDEIKARLIVNASGPWIDTVIGQVARCNRQRNVRLVQGSHIVVRRLFDHERCYFFQNSDGRIFFAIPYEQEFTLIGTTDRDFEGSPGDVKISEEEVDYLLEATNEYFGGQITRDEIMWTYSAVRPLYDDGASKAQEATRDYVLKLDGGTDEPKLLNIFGGKITTYRKLAEAAIESIDGEFNRNTIPWTSASVLPGGDFPVDGYDREVAGLTADFPFLDDGTVRRLVRTYGTRARVILGQASSWNDLGDSFGAGLTEREVAYLQSDEWAEEAEDILWRRSKLGLRLDPSEQARLKDWLAAHPFVRSADAA
ncbi:MAG: glycerol-3-phosphate dehydrogenase [Hyphomicrobiaceae bacterium]